MDIQLNLTVDEVNVILAILGDQPSKTGVFPLMQKITEQGNAQLPEEDNDEAE